MEHTKYFNTGLYKPESLEELLEMATFYVWKNREKLWKPFSRVNRAEITIEAVKGTGRARDLVLVRQIYMYFAQEIFPKAWTETIAKVCQKDRTMCYHAKEVIQNEIDTDRNFALHIELFRSAINQPKNRNYVLELF